MDELTTTSVTGQPAATTNIRSYPLPGGATAQRDSTGLYYLATDQLGTPIAALRLNDGTLTGTQLRTPYGQARYAAASTSNGGMHTTAGFTGQHEDSQAPGSSGLDYFNARYYDPLVGRFTSADDVVGTDPLLDGYAYVGGMVESAADPSGHLVLVEDPDMAGGGAEQGTFADAVATGPATDDGPQVVWVGDNSINIYSQDSSDGVIMISQYDLQGTWQMTTNVVSGSVAYVQVALTMNLAAAQENAGQAETQAGQAQAKLQELAYVAAHQPVPNGGGQTGTGAGSGPGTGPSAPPTSTGGSFGQQPPTRPAANGNCGCDYDKLYRGLSANEDPSQGLHPRRPGRGMSPAGHVGNGSHPKFKGSQYISTSVLPGAAAKYSSRIVEIDVSQIQGTVVDLSTDSGRIAAGLIPGSRAWRFAAADFEVLIDGWVPPSAITPFTGGPTSPGEC